MLSSTTTFPSACADAGIGSMAVKVLVILPPSHKCPNLDRVLHVARKAFCDQSLSLINLSLRFAKVSREELVPTPLDSAEATNGTKNDDGYLDDDDDDDDGDDDDGDGQPIGSLPPPLFSSVPNHPNPAAKRPPSHRIHVSNLSPAAGESDLLLLLPPGIQPEETSIHLPGPRGPAKEIVRSVTFIFKSEVEAAQCYKWIKEQSASGELLKLTLPHLKISVPTVPKLSLADTPLNKSQQSKPAVPAASAFANRTGPSASAAQPSNVPATSTRASDGTLRDTSISRVSIASTASSASTAKPSRQTTTANRIPDPPPGAPFIVVSNLQPALKDTQILTSLVPHPMKLVGALVYPARPVGPHKELVRSVKLAFKTLADAQKCHDWIKEHAVEKGTLEKLVIKKTKISVTRPSASRSAAASAPTTKAAGVEKRSLTVDNQEPVRPDLPNPATLTSASPDMYRLHIANLHPSTSDLRILSLLPPELPLAGATLYPPRPVGPRETDMRSVTFAFKDHESAQTCHEWIKEYGAGGVAAQVVAVKNVKVWVSRVVGPGETLREAAGAGEGEGKNKTVVADTKGKAKAAGTASPVPSRSQSRASAHSVQPATASQPSASTTIPTSDADDADVSVTVNGINPESPVATVMGAILDRIRGQLDPKRILQTGVKPLDGNGPEARGVQFEFDSQEKAKQFVMHMRQGVKEGWFKEISVVGSELRVKRV